ncbi:MAG: hypothetical protein WAO71_03615 [Gallionella sp.]
MATAFSVPASLRVRRSSQSADYIQTAAWQTVYSNAMSYAWMFASGEIDLSNMVDGDQIEIRVSKRNVENGAYIMKDSLLYEDAQPTGQKKITIGPIMDTYGVLIEMRQPAIAVALITCYCEFFDAIR